MNHSGVWTVSEFTDGVLKAVSFELLTWGRALADKLKEELSSVLMGADITQSHSRELIQRGADRVYVVEDRRLSHFLVEPYSAALIHLIETYKPKIVIAGATTSGRTLMPHVATRVNAGLTADCTGLDIEESSGLLLQTRPAIGGGVLAEIKTPTHRPQMATVRPRIAPQALRKGNRRGEVVPVGFKLEWMDPRVKRISFRKIAEEDINIQDAEILVSGGGGLKKAENFEMIRLLAGLLDGAVGASRRAVDRGWISYPHQVGLSGKTVTPKLYIAVCISGSVQHLAGMKTSETIVAINSDAEAPIFRVTDFAIVGDAFRVVPLLIEKLKERAHHLRDQRENSSDNTLQSG